MLWFPFLLLTLLWASCETTRQTWYHLDLTCASAFYYCQNSEILSVFSVFLAENKSLKGFIKRRRTQILVWKTSGGMLSYQSPLAHLVLAEKQSRPTDSCFISCDSWDPERFSPWNVKPREQAGMISISPSPLPSTPGGRQESCRGAAGCAEHRDGT